MSSHERLALVLGGEYDLLVGTILMMKNLISFSRFFFSFFSFLSH